MGNQSVKSTCKNCGNQSSNFSSYSPLCLTCRSLLQTNHKTYYFVQETPGYQLPEVEQHLVIRGRGDIKLYFGPDDDQLNIELVDAMLALLQKEWPSGEWKKETSKSDYLTPIHCPSIEEAVSDTPIIVGRPNKNTKTIMHDLLTSPRTKDSFRTLLDASMGDDDQPESNREGGFKL